ncbi:ROK family glucokinase [Bacillus tianshenii]|nr:ROK family glucokinase [Bacillus tianshenii]
MSEKWLVGIDLGGTSIKLAFITLDGELVHKWHIPTNTSDGGRNITSDIASSIKEQLSVCGGHQEYLQGIGMGAPAFIEMATGYVYHAVNIGWREYALKEELEAATGLPAVIDNDANVAAIGEMWKGAGDGSDQLLCVTLGTGVGGGIIINGEIVHGINGMAGEIGHITVETENGAPCNCGKTGCLETVASATGIVRLARQAAVQNSKSILRDVETLTAKDVFEVAEKGDTAAIQVIERVTHDLGLALANLSNAINPEKIVLGGGVSKAGNNLLKHLRKAFEKYALPRVSEGADLEIATLGNDAGVIGAAWLVKTKILSE